MKRKNVCKKVLAVLLPLLCLFITACQGSATPTKEYYTVYYETDHGTAPEAKKVLAGTVLKPEDLPKLTTTGYIFEGWYKGDSLITPELQYSVQADLFLKAKWKEDVIIPVQVFYNITYQTTYGQTPQSKKVLSGTKLTAADLPELSEEGYVFEGWYIGQTKISADYEVLSDITLVAKWSVAVQPVYYTITYISEYGTAPAPKEVISGYTLKQEDLPVLTAEGHTFDAWYIGGVKISAGQKVTCDLTLTANWGTEAPPVVQFKITYQTDYGTVESKDVNPGYILSTDDDLPTLSYSGYEFGGWYLNDRLITKESEYTVFADITLVAKWTPYYTISYSTQYETGTAPEQKTVLQGTVLTANDLPDLSHTGYDFDGWYIGQSKITAGYSVMDNITLTAKWTPVYTITFTTVHGTTPPAKTVRDGTSLSAADLAAPSYNGTDFEFDGWYNGSTKIQAGTTVTSSMTLTANWISYYTVSYINAFGNAPSTKRVAEGTKLTAADLPDNYTAQGYTFDGWYLGTEKVSVNYEVMSNITLMATWLKTYTVTYVSERGTVPPSKEVVDKTVLDSNDLQPLTANGYTFDGWYAGNTKITGSYQVIGDITLIGKWKYTISYASDHGAAPSSKPVVSGYKLTQTDLPTLSDSDGYRFTGWKIGSQAAAVNYTVADNITLTAQWVAIPSGVSLFVEAGSGVTEDELNFAVTSVKSGDDYILTATSGYDVYLWSVDEINLYDEEYFYYDVNTVEDDLYYGNIPTEITSNTLTFNENALPSGVSADGTYVVYVQAFKKIATDMVGHHNQTVYVYERAGIVFTVIRM